MKILSELREELHYKIENEPHYTKIKSNSDGAAMKCMLALTVYTKIVESGRADAQIKRLFKETLIKQSIEVVVMDYAIDLCLNKMAEYEVEIDDLKKQLAIKESSHV